MVSPSDFKIKMWQVLRTVCWVLLRVLLRSAERTLNLNISNVILSCRRDRLRHFNSANSSLSYVFLLADFVFIPYLTHFAITSFVIFTELCILLCYKVCIKIFNLRHIFCPPICLPYSSKFCRSCRSFLISPFCAQFHFFALVKLH